MSHGGDDKKLILDGLRTFFEHNIAEFDFLDLDSFIHWVDEWGISRALMLSIIFLGLVSILSLELSDSTTASLEWMGFWLIGTLPIWLPIALIIGAYRVWNWYAQSLYIAGRNPVLLEVKMPREVLKSPRAMEIALSSLWISSGEVTYLHRFWRGQVRPWYSFELVSLGGEVHFYIWCWKAYKHLMETALYAQYPEVEIYEVEDYASRFVYDPKIHTCFVTDYIYDKSNDAYPIKSYIDFELDKDPKEEFRIEPLGQVIETLGAIRKTEQIWVQITFRQAGKYGGPLSPRDSAKEWRARIKSEVTNIRKEASLQPGKDEHDALRPGFPHPTWSQTQQVQTIERHYGKLPFEVVMRGTYIADTTKGPFDGAFYTATRWIWRPFNNPGYLNSLRPKRGHNAFDYPWQDYKEMRWALVTRRFMDAYRRRSGLYRPWSTPFLVMSAEAIATLWHPPSGSVATPGLERIASSKSEPPPNLPV